MGPLGRQEMLQFVGGEALGIDHADRPALVVIVGKFNGFPLIKPDQLFDIADLLGFPLGSSHLAHLRAGRH